MQLKLSTQLAILSRHDYRRIKRGDQILPSTFKIPRVTSQHSKDLELVSQHSLNFQCIVFENYFYILGQK